MFFQYLWGDQFLKRIQKRKVPRAILNRPYAFLFRVCCVGAKQELEETAISIIGELCSQVVLEDSTCNLSDDLLLRYSSQFGSSY